MPTTLEVTGGLSADDLEILEALIEENGREALPRYINDTFSPTLIKVKRMTTENAAEWIDIANFTDWVVAVCQGQLRPAPETPRATPFRSITNQLSSTPRVDPHHQSVRFPAHQAIRDWIVNKDQSPWFFPSINEHLSKIPERIWYETDNTTNLNESAHPFTNQMTGTGRPLVESIEQSHGTRSLHGAEQKKKSLTQQGVKAPRAKRGSRGKNAPNAAETRRSSSPCTLSSPGSASPASASSRSSRAASRSFSPSLPRTTNTSHSRAPTTYLARPSADFAANFNNYTFSTQLSAIDEGFPVSPEDAMPPPVSQYAHWSPWFGSSMATPDVSAHPYTQPFDARQPSTSQVFGRTPSAPPSSGIFGWAPQD
ncbi:hypothetical protein EV121DRAFT_297482 [Schizophyllum commune]